MRNLDLRIGTAVSSLAIALLAGCSSNDSAGLRSAEEAGTSSGGAGTGSGGVSSGAGGSNRAGGTASGGKAATGGAVGAGGVASGGAPSTGGTNGTGGAPSTGGTNGTGGAASGGAPSTGGASGTGGVASGGASSTGGATGTGGAATGGAASTGGASGTGGAATGGASSTGGATGTGGAATDAGPHKRVFVTSQTFTANFKAATGKPDGLSGGDSLCQTAATTAGIGGTWTAWLSTSATDAIDRIADVGPWYLVTGEKAFERKAALTGNPLVAININENGLPNSGLASIPWTGTLANGTHAASNCANWESGTGSGECGNSAAAPAATWTAAGSFPCGVPYSLYCFEQ